jgi:type IV secretion system protein VirB1
MELLNCPNLAVPTDVMQHVVHVESSYNPYAIGVVGGRLARQPRNLPEALATVRMLETRGYNFSVGLAQVNRYNLGKYGLDSYERAFEACANLQAGSRILAECHGRSGGDWGKSFSCYYSGNFTTGFRHGYVQKIYASMRDDATTGVEPIEVIGKTSRRSVAIARHPVHSSNEQLASLRVGSAITPSDQTVSTFAPIPQAEPMAPQALDVARPQLNAPSAKPPTSQTQPVPKPEDAAFVF